MKTITDKNTIALFFPHKSTLEAELQSWKERASCLCHPESILLSSYPKCVILNWSKKNSKTKNFLLFEVCVVYIKVTFFELKTASTLISHCVYHMHFSCAFHTCHDTWCLVFKKTIHLISSLNYYRITVTFFFCIHAYVHVTMAWICLFDNHQAVS